VATYAQTTNRLMNRPGLWWLQQRLAFPWACGQTASGPPAVSVSWPTVETVVSNLRSIRGGTRYTRRIL